MLGSSSKIRVRRAKLADATKLADIFRDSWRLAYRGIIPHLHLETMILRRGVQWWRGAIRSADGLLVLDVDGVVAGYATFGMARAKGAHQGEIYEVYLRPDYQGLGFGEYLFEACRSRLDERKLKGLIVWALIDNTTATAFYWRRGGRPLQAAYDRVGGAKLQKVAFVWS
jgi:ribosomal protein S18 acetylase RimI-like enzyme